MSTAQLLPFVKPRWADSNGVPLASGQLFSYIAGTTTPQATYTDETAATPNANPVILDSTGSASVWLRTDLSYKLVLEDVNNNVLWTQDNINIVNPGSIDKTKIAANIAGVALAQNGGTLAIDVQVDGVTIGVNGSNQLQVGAITTSELAPASLTETLLIPTFDETSAGGAVRVYPQYEWSVPQLLNTSPATGSSAGIVKWDSSGQYLAYGSSNSPYLQIFQRNGNSFANNPNIGNPPNTGVGFLDWSPNGDFLACIKADSTNGLVIFQRYGMYLAAITAPSTTPGNVGGSMVGFFDIKFSPNGDFLALTCSTHVSVTGPHLLLYVRQGTSFTEITDAGGGSQSGITNSLYTGKIAWSPDSYILTAIVQSTGLPAMWTRSGWAFSSLTPPTMTSYANDITGMAFSPDGNLFAAAVAISPYVVLFQRSGTLGTTFTLLSNPATLPPGAASSVSWSANSEYLFVGDSSGTSPYMTIYKVTNPSTTPVFTAQAAPSSTVGGAVTNGDWTKTKQFLAVGTSGVSPYVQIYQTSSTISANTMPWFRTVPNV